MLFDLCPWDKNWPCLRGNKFTFNNMEKSSNDFLLKNLKKLGKTTPE